MKRKIFLGSAVALLLATATSASIAANGSDNLLGEPAQPASASRTVKIGADTTWVEVKGGEIVKFAVGDQTFAWSFDGASTLSEIDLNKIAPSGALSHLVKVYIDRTPAYDGA